jgi:serine/threonine protein phosphatase 1
MTGRLIAIGDVHGCRDELAALLDRLAPTAADRIVLLGDLINRGPDGPGVIALARACGAVSLLGNHELRLLDYRRRAQRAEAKARLRETDEATLAVLSEEDWAFMAAMPLTYEAPEYQTVLVHGGFLPGTPWKDQPAEVVCRIQVIDTQGRPGKRGEMPGAKPWADLWTAPPFVVYGHTSRPEIFARPGSVGIDTACVFGGMLTAYVLPERRFIQVRARRAYFPA